MATYVPAKRATAYRFTLSLFARSDNQIKTAPTLAAGDVKVSKDNGATANITTLPVETPASSGILQVDLSGTEMTADLVTVIFRDASGAEWNDVAVHIATAARQIDDLAYPATSGRSIDVDASGGVEVGSFQAGAITAAAIATGAIDADAIADNAIDAGAIATGAITAAKFAAGAIDAAALAADAGTEIGTAVWATTTRALTILDEDSTTLDLDATIRAAVGLASANLDTQIGTLATAANLSTVAGYIDTEVASILAAVDTEVASIITTLGVAGAGLTAIPWNIAWDAEVQSEVTDALVAYDPATGAEIAALNNLSAAQVNAEVDTALADYDAPTKAELDAAVAPLALEATLAVVDGVADAVKAKTDSLTFTVAGQVDANIQYVNDVQVNGNGQAGTEWGP